MPSGHRSTRPRARLAAGPMASPPILPTLAPVSQLRRDPTRRGKARVALWSPEQPPEKDALGAAGVTVKNDVYTSSRPAVLAPSATKTSVGPRPLPRNSEAQTGIKSSWQTGPMWQRNTTVPFCVGFFPSVPGIYSTRFHPCITATITQPSNPLLQSS